MLHVDNTHTHSAFCCTPCSVSALSAPLLYLKCVDCIVHDIQRVNDIKKWLHNMETEAEPERVCKGCAKRCHRDRQWQQQ